MITQNLLDRIAAILDAVVSGATPEAIELWQEFVKCHPADISQFFSHMDRDDAQQLFYKLPEPKRVAVFEELSQPLKIAVLGALGPQERATLLSHLPIDELADFLDELSDDELKKCLKLLQRKEREQVLSLLKFDPDTAGGLMHTNVLTFSQDLTVERAAQFLQRLQPDRELYQQIFVTDQAHRLVGYIHLEDLVLKSPKAKLSSIMRENELVVPADRDGEEVARQMKHYSVMIVPVVSSEQRFLGVISGEELVEIIEHEASEDIYRMAALAPIKYTYFETPFLKLLGQRLVILVILLFVQSLSTTIIQYYQATLEGFLLLFITMLTSTGGNASNQTSALVIQGMATGEIDETNSVRFIRRESLMAFVMGIGLGIFSFLRIYPVYGGTNTMGCFIVSLSLSLIVFFSVLLGGAMPLALKRIGVDPAHSAGPLLATLMDVVGLLIYCIVSSLILGPVA